MDTRLDKLIEKHRLTPYKDLIKEELYSCVAVTPERSDRLPVGASKMGGIPDLPRDWTTPEYHGRQLNFIAQINLKEIPAGIKARNHLPPFGLLYFFYYDHPDDVENMIWGKPHQKEGWRVLYHEGNEWHLQPRPLTSCTYPQCSLRFHEVVRLPDFYLGEDDQGVWDRTDDLLDEFNGLDVGEFHQMLGKPIEIQGEVFEECSEYTGVTAEEWTLLLQVDSDEENLGMMWGDVGILYFCIPTEALKKKQFDQAWCIMQCC